MLFDSHAHYNDERFAKDADLLLASMPQNNVGYIMNACSSTAEFPDILRLVEKFPFVYGAAGVHPHETETMTEEDIEKIKKFCVHPKIKAIGEIELDLASELKMPIIIHDRDAHKDTMDILKSHNAASVGGAFHCYTGSAEMVKEVLSLNMYIAFGGSLTFKKAQKPQEAAKLVPLDRLLIETDCPYLTPEPYRGKRNSSLYVRFVAEKLAEIKGVSVEEITKKTCENAKKCFGIDG